MSHQHTAHDHSGWYQYTFHSYKHPSLYHVQKPTVYKEYSNNAQGLDWPLPQWLVVYYTDMATSPLPGALANTED